MERDRSNPNLTQEQQQQLEQQKEQQKTQHQEQHLPQVMGQVNNELDKNPGAKQALAQLAPQQQSELKQQVAQAAFRGSGKNAPQIDYIGISKKDGSLVMQANKYFISNFDIPKSSLPQQPQPVHRHGLDGPGTYTIKPGDNLSRIGQRLSPNDQRLARAASELALYNLQDNGKLRQVGGETNRYIIQPGDKVTVDLSKYDQAGIDRLAHNYARRETNEHKQDVRIQQVQEQRAAARAAEQAVEKAAAEQTKTPPVSMFAQMGIDVDPAKAGMQRGNQNPFEFDPKLYCTPSSLGTAQPTLQFPVLQAPALQTAVPQEEPGLFTRFARGAVNGLKNFVVEPVLQVRDLGTAGSAVIYNEVIRGKDDAMWLPDMISGTAQASAEGTPQGKLILQSTPFLNVGVMTYDATTAAREGRWGDVAEMSGGIASGFATGKVVSVHGNRPITFGRSNVVTRGVLGDNNGVYYAEKVLPGGSGQAIAGHGELRFGSGNMVIPEGTRLVLPRTGIKISDNTGRVLEIIDLDRLAGAGPKTSSRLIREQLDVLGINRLADRKRVFSDLEGLQVAAPGDSIPNFTIGTPNKLTVFENSTTVALPTPLRDLIKPNAGTCGLATCTNFGR